MNRLWSPWRSKYIESFVHDGDGKEAGCIFCAKISSKDDESNLVVHRSSHSLIMMNLYPYNSGHLMVVPFGHKAAFEDLTGEENADVMRETRLSIEMLRLALHPDGFNFGANLGRVSGAGIADHIHFHIVPRWNGDTNFMPVLADTKIISEEMKDTWKKLVNTLSSIRHG